MYSSADTIWVLVATILVFFMQAGFAMLETGFTRAKNAGNIIMKNLMDFALGSLAFWILGFSLMHGTSLGGIIGIPSLFSLGNYTGSIPAPVYFMFQVVFCGTSATIVSGAMAERTKFSSYCISSIIISAIIYPISGHWIWSPDGWLNKLGFHDFAGSTAVHLVGGIVAIIGAAMLGARKGKYTDDGKSKAIPGHSLTLGGLGVFILWFCWFGFNGGSTLTATGDDALLKIGNILANTNISAAAGATTAMCITWLRFKKPDISLTLNGVLAGLVAITAGCDLVTPIGALFIGITAGFVIVFGVEFIDKILRIDDPAGAIGVHGLCGAAGTLLVGLFAKQGGLLYGGGAKLLITQAIGLLAVTLWVVISGYIMFRIIKSILGLRVSTSEELAGLDIEEHGLTSSYADFMPSLDALKYVSGKRRVKMDEAVAVEYKQTVDNSNAKMYRVDIIFNENRFEALKYALNAIGVTGMTVSNAYGCGMQKGGTDFYRGVEVEVTLLPKMRVEVVVCKVPVRLVIDTAKKALYTGKIGDGKIFVYDVNNVVKVRTGEEGYDALQDDN